jgi:hypothetical protein
MNESQDDRIENNEVYQETPAQPDEDQHVFVYGNLLIREVESNEILVNKSF